MEENRKSRAAARTAVLFSLVVVVADAAVDDVGAGCLLRNAGRLVVVVEEDVTMALPSVVVDYVMHRLKFLSVGFPKRKKKGRIK